MKRRPAWHLFGDDVFISYARADAINYALDLAARLTEAGLSCFLDQWGTPPGRELPAKVVRALRGSTLLVLVGSARAARSKSVGAEVELFRKTGRSIIPVSVGGALETAPWYPMIDGIAPARETVEALEHGRASDDLVRRIVNAKGFVTRLQRLRRAAAMVGVLIVAGLATVGVLAWQTMKVGRERARQERISGALELGNQASLLQEERPDRLETGALLAVEAFERLDLLGYVAPLSLRQSLRGNLALLARPAGRLEHRGGVRAVAAGPGGRLFVTAGEDGLRLWSCASGPCRPAPRPLRNSDVWEVALDGGGRFLAASAQEEGVEVWDLAAGGGAPAWRGAAGAPAGEAVAFGPGWLAAGNAAEVSLWAWRGTTTPRAPLRILRHAPDSLRLEPTINDLDFSPDGRYLATASMNVLTVWEVATGDSIWVDRGTQAEVRAVAFSPDGRSLAAGGVDGLVRVWHWRGSRTDTAAATYARHPDGVSSLAFAPDGRFLAAGSWDRTARVWRCDAVPCREVTRVVHGDIVQAVTFAGDGALPLLASAGEDGMVRISAWEAREGSFRDLAFPESQFLATALSPNGAHLVWIDCDFGEETPCRARQREVARGHGTGPITVPEGYFVRSAVSPDGRYLALGEGGVREAATGRQIWKYPAGADPFPFFTPRGDGFGLLSGNRLELWEWHGERTSAAPARTVELKLQKASVLQAAVDWDGRFLVAAVEALQTDPDHPVVHLQLFDLTTGAPIGASLRHPATESALTSIHPEEPNLRDDVMALALSPDGAALAVVVGQMVEIYPVDPRAGISPAPVLRERYPRGLRGAAFGLDGRLITDTGDGGVQALLWREVDVIRETCVRLDVRLTSAEWRRYVGGEPYRATGPLPRAGRATEPRRP